MIKNADRVIGSFSILGDSYSTFRGYIPEGNSCYYPNPENVDDVLQVEQTWWHILMTKNNLQLLRNESYSGATVCTHTREGQPLESSFTVRAHYLKNFVDENGAGPELIILFGCTNDSWQDREVGQVMFENRTEAELRCVLPAYCETVEVLQKENPGAKVVCVINTDLKPEIIEGILASAAHYGATAVKLADIDKQNGHPSALGMRQIAEQVEAAVFCG